MLKIFEPTFQSTEWSSKINFVDDNNVVVGYDMAQNCCERAEYCFSTDPNVLTKTDTLDQAILDKLVFDPNYFHDGEIDGGESFDVTAHATFKLDGDTHPWYLILSNTHNGYYSHGFDVTVNGIQLRGGRL